LTPKVRNPNGVRTSRGDERGRQPNRDLASNTDRSLLLSIPLQPSQSGFSREVGGPRGEVATQANGGVSHASIQRFVQITQAFDPEATRVLGQAFDMACALLGRTPQPTVMREAIAKSIIETAKAGERDLVRLRGAGTSCAERYERSVGARRTHRPKGASSLRPQGARPRRKRASSGRPSPEGPFPAATFKMLPKAPALAGLLQQCLARNIAPM
jgi:hypothetical protein